jgi:phage shock protein A
MFKLFVRVWRYTAAFLTHVLEERADPRIQIEQAIEEGKQQHLRLQDSAAAIIGGRMELEAKITRASQELRQLEARAGQALRLADQASAKGDTSAAERLQRNAEIFAAEIAAKESSLVDLRELHARAAITASTAQRAVEQNKAQLRQQITERMRMLNDLAAAEMQERLVAAIKAMDALAPVGAVPTLPQLEERITRRLARSGAQIETLASALESGVIHVDMALQDQRSAEILAEIRKREGLPAHVEETPRSLTCRA